VSTESKPEWDNTVLRFCAKHGLTSHEPVWLLAVERF